MTRCSQRRRTPVKWAALTGVTAVAAAISILILVGRSEPRVRLDAGPRPTGVQVPAADAQYVFAGWSAAPTSPAGGQLGTAGVACQAQVAKLRPSNMGTDAASLVPELSDVRGPYTVTVFGNGGRNAAWCMSGPDATTSRWMTRSNTPVGAGAIAVDQVSVLTRGGQQYTLVEGRTGAGVTGVVFALGNGNKATATRWKRRCHRLVAREPEHHLGHRRDRDRRFDADLEPGGTW